MVFQCQRKFIKTILLNELSVLFNSDNRNGGKDMNIQDFAEIVKNNVEKKIGKDYQVTVQKAAKNNGVIYTGLCIKRNGLDAAPLIYLDDYFEKYKKNYITLLEVTEHVIRYGRKENQFVDIKRFLNYENVRDKIVYRLINTESNRELLKHIPHVEFLDLSIVFRYLLKEKAFGSASILIYNDHMKLWDVTIEELYESAKENSQRLERPEIKSMVQVLCDIMEDEAPDTYDNDACIEEFSDSMPMYVLSNENRIEGSACMLYLDVIKNFANRIESSLYIIPSSIHELLLVPAEDFTDSGHFKNMIKEVNDTQVKKEERLSYSLYCYDRKKDRISIL